MAQGHAGRSCPGHGVSELRGEGGTEWAVRKSKVHVSNRREVEPERFRAIVERSEIDKSQQTDKKLRQGGRVSVPGTDVRALRWLWLVEIPVETEDS